jgi:hypothetical protein
MTRGALYIAWRMPGPRAASRARRRLAQGEAQHLYRLHSWAVRKDEAHALLTPDGPLDEIVSELWHGSALPLETRWVQGDACAQLSREIGRIGKAA